MLVAAIAGLPAVAAAVGMEDAHAGHAAMHAAPSADDSHAGHGQDHAHGGESHHHHGHDPHAGHADESQHDHHAPATSDASHAGDPLGYVDCVDASCLASCSACGHCQGMPTSSGTDVPDPVKQAMSLYSFQSGPPAAALYRPPILS
ncbi:hypothetical protein [Thioalkalivibrio sp. ALgr3]|uniref:hypothetical protein n=1 Tax=Thioalkalivibrio sp. ALgr3 TaxID=1239292 RepID=UPI0018CA5CA3|nr:hypothetical protein [Thioalkalivibrio sp. ALgr3]